MASYLELDQPERYTGHSFRRTAATHMAENGATEQNMKLKFDWKDGKMTKEYMTTSKRFQREMATMLQGGPAEKSTEKSPAKDDEDFEPGKKAPKLDVSNFNVYGILTIILTSV